MLEVLAPAVLISREMSVSMVTPGVSQRSGPLERTAEGELCHAVPLFVEQAGNGLRPSGDRKSTRLNSSHVKISYAVFCLKKKKDVVRVRGHRHLPLALGVRGRQIGGAHV